MFISIVIKLEKLALKRSLVMLISFGSSKMIRPKPIKTNPIHGGRLSMVLMMSVMMLVPFVFIIRGQF